MSDGLLPLTLPLPDATGNAPLVEVVLEEDVDGAPPVASGLVDDELDDDDGLGWTGKLSLIGCLEGFFGGRTALIARSAQ